MGPAVNFLRCSAELCCDMQLFVQEVAGRCILKIVNTDYMAVLINQKIVHGCIPP